VVAAQKGFEIELGREHMRTTRIVGMPGVDDRGKCRMTTKVELRGLVGKALGQFHNDSNNRPGDPLSIETIVGMIEEIIGERLYDEAAEDIKNDMIRREKARQGVKRLSNSADIWALERWFDLDKD
jgi:hypothetical protein